MSDLTISRMTSPDGIRARITRVNLTDPTDKIMILSGTIAASLGVKILVLS